RNTGVPVPDRCGIGGRPEPHSGFLAKAALRAGMPAQYTGPVWTAVRDAGVREMAAGRGWGMLAKPVTPPARRALMSPLLIRHRG
ncbi:hypothetical protein Q7C02_015395, partial [Stenotrophomonas sp. RAC2]|nr:hypothetical protein [Stenotrophomonas sp. RAC2]